MDQYPIKASHNIPIQLWQCWLYRDVQSKELDRYLGRLTTDKLDCILCVWVILIHTALECVVNVLRPYLDDIWNSVVFLVSDFLDLLPDSCRKWFAIMKVRFNKSCMVTMGTVLRVGYCHHNIIAFLYSYSVRDILENKLLAELTANVVQLWRKDALKSRQARLGGAGLRAEEGMAKRGRAKGRVRRAWLRGAGLGRQG